MKLKKGSKGFHRSAESLREEIATGWSFIDGFLVGLTVGFAVAAIIVISRYGI